MKRVGVIREAGGVSSVPSLGSGVEGESGFPLGGPGGLVLLVGGSQKKYGGKNSKREEDRRGGVPA